jgi:hypothetical protein
MLSVPALITLTCAILAGCTGVSPASTNRASTPAPSHSPATGTHRTGPLGTTGNPLVLACADEAFGGTTRTTPPVPSHPGPEDLAIGPLYITGGKMVATMTPTEYGYSPYGRSGRVYKMGLVVTKGATATLTIAPPPRGHVVIDNLAAQNRGLGGVTSITYHSCPHKQGFFVQGFAFTHPPTRGCVALDVTINNRPPAHRVILSLFAGPCAHST